MEWRLILEKVIRGGCPEKVATETKCERQEQTTRPSRERAFRTGTGEHHGPEAKEHFARTGEWTAMQGSLFSPLLARHSSITQWWTEVNRIIAHLAESMWPMSWAQQRVPVLNCSHGRAPSPSW